MFSFNLNLKSSKIILSVLCCAVLFLKCTKASKGNHRVAFSSNSDSLKVEIKKNPVKLISFCDSVILNSHQFSKLDVALAHFYKGSSNDILNNHQDAKDSYQKALQGFKAIEGIEDKAYIVKALIALSNSNTRLKNHTAATTQAIEALNYAKDLKDKVTISNVYSTLSYLAYANEDYPKSISYLQESISLLKNTNYKEELSTAYNNLSIVYKHTMQFDKARSTIEEALTLSKADNDFDGMATAYINIGSQYQFTANYEMAKKNYNKALDIYASIGIKNSIPHINLFDIYTQQKKHDSAAIYIKNALKIERPKNNPKTLASIYGKLNKNAFELKAYEESKRYQTSLDSINFKVENLENQERITMLESQSKLLQNKFDLEVARSAAKTTRIVMFSLGLLIVFVLLFFYQLFKTTKLNHQQNRNQLELKVLRSQMNPHFIFNALSAIQNTVMDGEPIKSASYLSRFAKLIRQNFEFTSKEQITLQDDIDALTNYLETQKIRFKDKFIYHIKIDDNIDTQNTPIPPMLLQPFVENAIEHGFKNINRIGILKININAKNSEQIAVEIEDNGKGYFPKQDDNEHATAITKKRLQLLSKGNENSFQIKNLGKDIGTKVSFTINY